MTKPKFFVNSAGQASSKKLKPEVSMAPIQRDLIPIEYMCDDELQYMAFKGHTLIYDTECYPNYWLGGFRCVENGKYVTFEISPNSVINYDKFDFTLKGFRLVTFYGRQYDEPMTLQAQRGFNAEMLKYYSNRLIRKDDNGKPVRVDWRKEFNLKSADWDHIDLIEVCPLQGSLKKYGARLHAKRLQELPFDPHKILTQEEAELVKNYCLSSDIPATQLILENLSEPMKLRYDLSHKYKIDLRSKSDAQIAESIVKSNYKEKLGKDAKLDTSSAGTSFQYVPPPFIKFQTPALQRLLKTVESLHFEIDEDLKMGMPELLAEMETRIGKTDFKLGKGGLHSKEKCAAYKAVNGMLLIDSDVASYYPRLILNSGMFPPAIGPIFLEIFEEIVNRRLAAKKHAKDCEEEFKQIADKFSEKYKSLFLQFEISQSESDGLKITINGVFGKLGSKWSIMFAPNLLIQVTLTGQLALLMLIERFELANIEVVSANTDGVVAYCHESKYEQLKAIREQWAKEASLEMEETRYLALYSRDVNNYIAVKAKFDKKAGGWTNEYDSCKFKGAYLNPWNDKKLAIFRFHKNPVSTICIEAVEAMLVRGVPVAETVRACRDITRFLTVREVKGGAHRKGQFIGKLVRYVYAAGETGEFNYVESGNKVPDSEGAVPIMDLPNEFPNYIDYQKYIEKADSILFDIGFYKRPGPVALF